VLRIGLVSAGVILWTIAGLAGPCLAGEPGVAEERDVPEPLSPALEAVPRGFEPGTWTSWTANQEVDRLPRISLDLSFGAGSFAPEPAGSGTDAPSYSDFASLQMGFSLRFAYNLTPALGIALGTCLLMRSEGTVEIPGTSGSIEADLTAGPVSATFLGLRLSLPFAHLGGRPFRFSRTEAPTGFAAHVLAGLGFAYLGDVTLWYSLPGSGFTEEHTYWRDTVNPCFLLGVRLEYRWVNFGIFVDFTMTHLGQPEPTDDPLWADSSVASPMIAFLGSLGLSLHF
jgi:hypothetical protein